MGQPFLALAFAQDKEGKQGELLTKVDDKPEPMLFGVGGPSIEARTEAAEKMVIARLAKEGKYDPEKDNIPIVFLLPFHSVAELRKK